MSTPMTDLPALERCLIEESLHWFKEVYSRQLMPDAKDDALARACAAVLDAKKRPAVGELVVIRESPEDEVKR